MGITSKPWPEPATEILKAMWAEGYAGTAISRALALKGYSFSRCAVLGRVDRLGLPSRATNRQPKSTKIKTPAKMALPSINRADEPKPLGTIGEFSPGCQYIHGSIRDGDWRMCAADAVGSWCNFHRSIVFVPAKTRL